MVEGKRQEHRTIETTIFNEAEMATKTLHEFKSNFIELLKTNKSFNFQNYFCSTNFGQMQGAHHYHNQLIKTNFDESIYSNLQISTSAAHVDCLVAENTDLTAKFWLSKSILQTKFSNLNENKLEHYKQQNQSIRKVFS
jgi:hypothetical protein